MQEPQQDTYDDLLAAETQPRAEQEMSGHQTPDLSQTIPLDPEPQMTVEQQEALVAQQLVSIMNEYGSNMGEGTICRADVDELLGVLVKFNGHDSESPAIRVGVVIELKPLTNEVVVFSLTPQGQQILTLPKSDCMVNIGNVIIVQKLYDARTRLLGVESTLSDVIKHQKEKEEKFERAITQLQNRLDELKAQTEKQAQELTALSTAAAIANQPPPASTTSQFPSSSNKRR